jgi:L-fuconolactonase
VSGRIDAHVHLWNRVTDPQPWIDPVTMAAIDRDFAPDDLTRMLTDTGIDTAVVVQTVNEIDETRRLLSLAAPVLTGVVGWVDLTGDVRRQLEELLPGARGRLVGIRHLAHVDPDPRWLDRPDVGASLDALAAHGLGFDLIVRWWQLDLAESVVDHLGGIAECDDDDGWERGLRSLAALPNVSAKISGLAGMVPDAGRLRGVVGVALEAFGPHRLMYGSDWPLARLGVGPEAWYQAVNDLISDLSPGERAAITSGTASAWYRLDA